MIPTEVQSPQAVPPVAIPRLAEATQAGDPAATYAALRAQLRVVGEQVATLEGKRTSIAGRLRAGNTSGADRAGLEERLTVLDKQIVAGYQQLATAQAAVAAAAAVPGSVVAPPPYVPSGPPDGAFAVGVVFILAVMLPISISIARRIWRRSSAAVTTLPKELIERLNRLEESVDAVAIEVERIGEGQRFVTNLFIESGAPQMLGAGAAEPIEARQRERVEQERRL